MKKLIGIMVVGFGISGAVLAVNIADPAQEWKHIVGATRKIATDPEMQQSIRNIFIAVQKALSLGAKKISLEVSPAEKEKLAKIIQLLKRMLDTCDEAVRAGVAVDGPAAEELNRLGQELMVLVMPLFLLVHDPSFTDEQMQLLQDIRLQAYEGVQRTITTLGNDLR